MTADVRPLPPPLGRGDRFTAWTMRSTLRRATVMGLTGAVIFGVLQGIEARSADRGLIEGLFFGVLFGAMTPTFMDRKVRSVTGLSRADTSRLLRAIQTGQVPDEPVMARAVLLWVAQIRKVQRSPRSTWVVCALFAVAAAVWLVFAVADRDRASAVTAGLTLVLWTFVVIRVPRRRAILSAKADRAEAAALVVLGKYNAR